MQTSARRQYTVNSLLSGGGGGVATSGGVDTFGGPLLSGFTSGHKKLTLISGGRYYRNFTVLYYKAQKSNSGPASTARSTERHYRCKAEKICSNGINPCVLFVILNNDLLLVLKQ